MAPTAFAIPQYTNNPLNNNIFSTKEDHFDKGACSTMENNGALDFDLLAEYLLEDVGAGGFDFSDPGAVTPPTLNALKQVQPALVSQDPGVVTPHQSYTSFADPLSDVAAALQQQPAMSMVVPPVPTQPLPASGDMSGELSQVQQMMAAQQQQHPVVMSVAPVAPPPQQQQQQPRTTPLTQPTAPNNAMTSIVRHPPPQQQLPKPAAPMAAAPLTQRPPMPKQNGMSMVPMAQQQQPPNKRPRVTAPAAKGPSYSFSSIGAAHGHGVQYNPLPTPAQAAAAAAGGGSNRQKSQAQIDRRRERNRILARRTRLRKKFFFESLQKDVSDLQRENAALKSIVRSRLKPDDAKALLSRCNANEKLPSAIHDPDGLGPGLMGGEAGGDVKKLDKEDFSLIQSIQNSQQCFIITDPSLHDNPIVYASDDFLTLTGYSQEEVLGRNCRFLQGTETCQEKVGQIRKAVEVGEDVNVTFANYTADGKPFWNSLFIAALRDADNNIVNFIGVIVKVAGPEPGDSEYGKVLK